MKVVLDTNVFVSAVFFGGIPGKLDDDKFLAAALGGAARTVVSGDAHLRAVSGYRQVEVMTPAEFIKRYGSEQAAAAGPAGRGSAQP